jgi:hypothetical protein
MAHIEVSDATYEMIETLAKEKGLTPSEWLEAQFSPSHAPVNADEGQAAREALSPFIGAIDSSKERPEPPANEQRFKSVAEAIAPHTVDSRAHTPDPKYRSAFGDIVDEKMEKQGFKRPE